MMSHRGLAIFRVGWITVIVIITSAPYFVNWLSTPVGYHYTWILPPYPEDSFGYMSWAQQGAHGAWLFKIKYTALPHAPFLFHPFFLVCGWLSTLFSCEIGVVFWVVKAVGVALFLLIFYRYIDYLGLSAPQSITASIFLGGASGVGAILVWSGANPNHWAAMPADLWMPEVSTFWSLMWNPLFPFSLALMLSSIFWLDRGTRQDRTGDLWLSGLSAGVMTLIHPYSLPLLFALAATITIARKKMRGIGYLSRYLALALPFTIYVVAVSQLNPLVARHSLVGAMKSPPLAAYALGFGLPLLLLPAGLALFRGQLLKRYWQIILWFFLAILLAYFPFWFQRKLIFGAHIPLCIISGILLDSAIAGWLPERKRQYTWVAAVLFLPLFASTSYYLLLAENREVKANQDGAYFLSDEMVEALKALRQQSRPDDVVLATYRTSRLIPALAGNTTVWGHWAMSVDYRDRDAKMGSVFDMASDLDDEARANKFWGSNIQFLFVDEQLKQSMTEHPFLWGLILRDARKIFQNRSLTIYQRQKRS